MTIKQEQEPTWLIKPTEFENVVGAYGLQKGGDYGFGDGTGHTVWYVTYASQDWVDFEQEFDGNTAGTKVGDFLGVPVGGLANIDNFAEAVGVCEDEVTALVAAAKEEFQA